MKKTKEKRKSIASAVAAMAICAIIGLTGTALEMVHNTAMNHPGAHADGQWIENDARAMMDAFQTSVINAPAIQLFTLNS